MQNKNRLKNNRDWKEKNKRYLYELQKFFDKVDNIKDEELKESIISQMLKCDKVLTEIIEEIINEV